MLSEVNFMRPFQIFSTDLFQGKRKEKVNLQYSFNFSKVMSVALLKEYVECLSDAASKTFAKQSDLKWYLPNS